MHLNTPKLGASLLASVCCKLAQFGVTWLNRSSSFSSVSSAGHLAQSPNFSLFSLSWPRWQDTAQNSWESQVTSTQYVLSYYSTLLNITQHSLTLLNTPLHYSTLLDITQHSVSLLNTPWHYSTIFRTPKNSWELIRTTLHSPDLVRVVNFKTNQVFNQM